MEEGGRIAELDVHLGTTGVIRWAERNSEIIAERAIDVIMIPGELSERLGRLPAEVASERPSDLAEWLRDLVEDPRDDWRSDWLRACAIHFAKTRSLLGQCNLGRARALGDPVIDEVLSGP